MALFRDIASLPTDFVSRYAALLPTGVISATSQPLTETAKTVTTGTETDDKFSAQIIGKDIPIFVGGEALIGCRIYEGPFITSVDSVGMCDMIVGCAVAATPTATRTITYLNLNGTTSATSADGGATWTPIGSAFSGLVISVKTGTEDQTPFASSVSRYGARAVPYRSHICIEIKNIPLAVFNNEIPFVSVFVHESSSLTRNDALTALARYCRYNDDEFEFSVTGSDTFWIVAQQTTFLQYLQNMRSVFRNWNITLTDKLRVVENDSSGGVTVTLTRNDIVADSINLRRADPLSVPAKRQVGFINTDKDNDFDSVTARRSRFPIPLTASENTDSYDLSIGATTLAMRAAANRSILIDDIARTQFACTVMPAKRGIEPGDIVGFSDDPSITFEGRVISVARKAADWTADIVAEKIDFFTLNTRPVITSNGGGATASVSIAENTTAVTTVVATDTDGDGIYYSITGGADAALFSLNSATGALSFTSPPDYEAPHDADTNNVYVVTVQASDGVLTDTQTISVTVTNVVESGILIGFPFPMTKV